jgi:hypothetical protein
MATIVNIGSAANDGTGDTLRVAFGKINDNFPYVTPEQYGALGDGSTNDQAAIASAVATGFPVFFGQKNYRVTSTTNLPTGTTILGCGASSIISTTSNISVFTVTGSGVTIDNISFTGNSTGASQRAIDVTGNAGLTLAYNNIKLNGLTINLFGGSGIYATLVVGHTGSFHEGSVKAVNCFINSCGTGINADTRAEYLSFTGCHIYACTVGLRIVGGNGTFKSGSIVDCTTVISHVGGTNDGKWQIEGNLINHNTTVLTSAAVTSLGSIYTNNSFCANGTLTLTSSPHKFNTNLFSTTTINITNSGTSEWINNKFLSASPTVNLTGTKPLCFGNTFDSGVVPAALQNSVIGVQNSSVTTQFDKTSDTTLANITGLTATLSAGLRYRFEATLFTTSNIAGGVKAAIAGTATATSIVYEGFSTDAGVSTQTRGAALAAAVGAVTAVTAAQITIKGTIVCNAAGTLTVQFAQNASNGTASSVLVGSSFTVTDLV